MEDKLASSSDMLFANVANLHTTYVRILTYLPVQHTADNGRYCCVTEARGTCT